MQRCLAPFARLSYAGLFLLVLAAAPAVAQTSALTGRVVAAGEEGVPLPGANVVATRVAADSARAGTMAATDGTFRLELPAGAYRLRFSFIGYETATRRVELSDGTTRDVGAVALETGATALPEVIVEAARDPVALRGDTTVYRASSYQVNPDADVERLISKMPGILVQDGTVQAQGEDVDRVLVDGEEFFGDDPTAALRNLPAEIVQDIEVYDRQSDQAQFTGFDDGNEEKTINIVTRPDRRQGQFGHALAGGGTGARYAAGGAVNLFDGDRRISAVALSNNVGRQNFSAEDLLGVMSAGGGRGRGRRGGSRGGGGGRRGGGGSGGGRGGGGSSDAESFLIGDVEGIPTTHSFGLNYNDDWGQWADVSGSYFFNRTSSDVDAALEREYFRTGAENQRYAETSDAQSDNTNHRFDARLEATLSESTDLIVRPRMSVQQNASGGTYESRTALTTGAASPLSAITSATTDEHTGYSASADALLRHRFSARGRTVSLGLGLERGGRQGDTDQDVERLFYEGGGLDSTSAYERQIDSDGTQTGVSARLVYTEPLGERGQLMAEYRPSLSWNAADQDAFLLDEATGAFTLRDSAYTARSEQRVATQRGGLSYQYRGEPFRVTVGADLQSERFYFDQNAPEPFNVERSYFSVLPSARLRYDLGRRRGLGLTYRASTNTPSARDLTGVVDDTNPLLLSSGNPDLQTSTSHQLRARYRTLFAGGAQTFFGLFSLEHAPDYIGSATVLATDRPQAVRGVTLQPGAQFTFPVNAGAYWNARSVVSYGRPVDVLKSNVNARAHLGYTRTPALVNGVDARTDALQAGGRLSLGSNVSERLDFSLSYGLDYTAAAGTAEIQASETTVRHRGQTELHWRPWEELVLDTDLDASYYAGLSGSADPLAVRWDLGVGYKFLEGNAAEIRLGINDVLDRQADVRQEVTDLYSERRSVETLGRHLMLSLTYRLRDFG